MSASDDPAAALRRFLADGRFARSGAFFTDLDGTAVVEHEGRIVLPPEVEAGLERVHDAGRLVVANTLRFPLSVIRVFGDEWQRATAAPLPLVSMKGSQIGRVVRAPSGEMAFEEWQADVLDERELREIVDGIRSIGGGGIDDLLVFHYARDWCRGERIWTPQPARIEAVRDKYRSASEVWSSGVDALLEALLAAPHCMVFLLIDAPEDRLMAYQHTQRSSFFTHAGIGKRDGSRRIAARLGIDLAASIGAGDAPPDDFLAEVGFAIVVGANDVDYRGLADTVRVDGTAALGRLLAVIGDKLEATPPAAVR